MKDYIPASADQVAMDAIAARMMGFDPMKLDFIRLAHEDGLGCGNPSQIEVVGEDIADVNWGFQGTRNTFASRGQKLIYWGPLKFLERLLLRTFLVPWSYAVSILYHDCYWYPFIGRRRVKAALRAGWGKQFGACRECSL